MRMRRKQVPVALQHEEDGGSRKTYGPNQDLGGTRYRGVGLLVTFATSRYRVIEIVESVERGWGVVNLPRVAKNYFGRVAHKSWNNYNIMLHELVSSSNKPFLGGLPF